MTPLRRLLGFGMLLVSRAILWAGTKLSWVAWWLMDREDMIAAQKAVTRAIATHFDHLER